MKALLGLHFWLPQNFIQLYPSIDDRGKIYWEFKTYFMKSSKIVSWRKLLQLLHARNSGRKFSFRSSHETSTQFMLLAPSKMRLIIKRYLLLVAIKERGKRMRRCLLLFLLLPFPVQFQNKILKSVKSSRRKCYWGLWGQCQGEPGPQRPHQRLRRGPGCLWRFPPLQNSALFLRRKGLFVPLKLT